MSTVTSPMVRDVMKRGVVTCRVTATAEEMARIMIENGVSALVVTDERLDACGVVTKTDLAGRYGEDLSAITAEDIMSGGVFAVSPLSPVDEAVRLMVSRRIHQLVVVTEASAHRRPVGIFTLTDAVALMAGSAFAAKDSHPKCQQCVRRFLGMAESADDEGAACEEHPNG